MSSLFFFIGLVLEIVFVSHVLQASYVAVTPPSPTCATIDCLPNQTCKMYNGVSECVKIPGADCNIACTLEFDPVCGSDGKTYPNACALKVAACKAKKPITVASFGACPVGCEAVTCLLPKVCKEINGRGTCVCPTACPKILRPVCGSDGVTYNNECLLKVEACKTNKDITVASQGRCPTGCAAIKCKSPRICEEVKGVGNCVCPSVCPAVFMPVCGSDGKTYSNQCHLGIAACNSNKVITVVSQGPCPQPTTTPTKGPICDPIICASPNVCKLVNGKSKCICSKFCTLEFMPVCGSDRKTYSNKCFLRVAACNSNKRIKIVSQGPCPQTTPAPTQAPNCDPIICARPNVCKRVNGKYKCICSQICTLEFMPVCGSDGKTYSNTCHLRLAACDRKERITVESKGPCPPTITCANVRCAAGTVCKMIAGKPVCCPKACPKIYKPVCGSDGKTYSNTCLLRLAACNRNKRITVASEGACAPTITCANVRCAAGTVCKMIAGKPVCCPKACPKIYKPVCGSDGKTYSNTCLLRLAACDRNKRITVASEGACAPTITCANVLCVAGTVCKMIAGKPVCCPKACPKIYKPVCGSDKVTYNNKCLLERASCKKGIALTVKYNRPCGNVCFDYKCRSPPYSKCEKVNGRPKCVCKFFCDEKQDLVCGSDGKTYDNICIMKQTACQSNKNITVASKKLCKNPCLQARPCRRPPYSFCRPVDGKAKCVCNEVCPAIYSPVCGSDGKTYSNECKMKASSCRRNKKVTVKSIGKCINPCVGRKCTNYATCVVKYGKAVCVCPKACTRIYRPVCGTDGQTYGNECMMKVASCERGQHKKKIKVAYKGECRPNAYPVY